MSTAPVSARRRMLRGARFALHLITVVLVVVTTVRAAIDGELLPVLLTAAVYLAWYGAGAGFAHKRVAVWWMLGLLAIWIGMLTLSAEFVWLAFPLLLLAGHVLRLPWSLVFAVVVLVASIVAPMLHPGVVQPGGSIAHLIGPLVGGGFAFAVSLGYDAMLRDAVERERLIDSLLRAQREAERLHDELAASQREAGATLERTRLARDLHDTIAQELSTIVMLARTDPAPVAPGADAASAAASPDPEPGADPAAGTVTPAAPVNAAASTAPAAPTAPAAALLAPAASTDAAAPTDAAPPTDASEARRPGASSPDITGRAARPDRTAQIEQLARHSLTELRRIVAALAPADLDESALAAALARMLAALQEETGVSGILQVDPDLPALPTPVEVALLRVAQSALANVRQHAQARSVEVALTAGDGVVRLRVSDDGVGFDQGVRPSDASYGLAAMRSRLREGGGELSVVSSPGEGTTIDATLPLRPGVTVGAAPAAGSEIPGAGPRAVAHGRPEKAVTGGGEDPR